MSHEENCVNDISRWQHTTRNCQTKNETCCQLHTRMSSVHGDHRGASFQALSRRSTATSGSGRWLVSIVRRSRRSSARSARMCWWDVVWYLWVAVATIFARVNFIFPIFFRFPLSFLFPLFPFFTFSFCPFFSSPFPLFLVLFLLMLFFSYFPNLLPFSLFLSPHLCFFFLFFSFLFFLFLRSWITQIQLRSLGIAVSSPSRVRAEPQPRLNFVHFSLKIWHLVAVVFNYFLEN